MFLHMGCCMLFNSSATQSICHNTLGDVTVMLTLRSVRVCICPFALRTSYLPLQAISAMEARLQDSEVPNDLRCPITYQLLQDPVILVDSHQTYERAAIEEWLARGNLKDPITGRDGRVVLQRPPQSLLLKSRGSTVLALLVPQDNVQGSWLNIQQPQAVRGCAYARCI